MSDAVGLARVRARASGVCDPLLSVSQSRAMAQSRVMEQSSNAFAVPTVRERLDRDGWALVQRFITSREIEALRKACDELARKGAHLTADAEIDGARYQVQTASGRRGEIAIAPGTLRKITSAPLLPGNERRVLMPGKGSANLRRLQVDLVDDPARRGHADRLHELQDGRLPSAPGARVGTESVTASAPPRDTVVHRRASHHSATPRAPIACSLRARRYSTPRPCGGGTGCSTGFFAICSLM